MKRRWHYLNREADFVANLSEELKVSQTLVQILVNRGLQDPEKIKDFFNYTKGYFLSAGDIPQTKEAAEYVLKFIKADKKITIYGDYDVDGVTSTALLVTAFKEMGARQINYYIPHRFSEGYGLNKTAIKKLADAGTELIVTVDCGISNYDEITYAKTLGLSVVVSDHHLPPVVYPKADFIVNPKTNNKSFAARDLAGVGVAFMLAEQMFQLLGFASYSCSKKYLDLVALGTIADIVPLLEENRHLAALGLQQLNHFSRLGLKTLAQIAGIEKKVSARDISFVLAPRINAAGRMEHAKISVDLLLASNFQEAKALAQQLNELNILRQNTGNSILEEVLAQIADEKDHNDNAFVLFSKNWHPGILGIVASQTVKKYNKPTVLISEQEGVGRGSIRSPEGVNIFEPLSKCGYLLKDFGGHKEAAGFEIELSKIPEFKAAYTKILNETVSNEDMLPVLDIDLILPKEKITAQLAHELQRMAPFGQSNKMPIFSTKDLSVIDFRYLSGNKHLKITLSDGKNLIDGIAFGMGELFDLLMHGHRFEIAFCLEINEWQGEKKLQLNIKDIREAQ